MPDRKFILLPYSCIVGLQPAWDRSGGLSGPAHTSVPVSSSMESTTDVNLARDRTPGLQPGCFDVDTIELHDGDGNLVHRVKYSDSQARSGVEMRFGSG